MKKTAKIDQGPTSGMSLGRESFFLGIKGAVAALLLSGCTVEETKNEPSFDAEQLAETLSDHDTSLEALKDPEQVKLLIRKMEDEAEHRGTSQYAIISEAPGTDGPKGSELAPLTQERDNLISYLKLIGVLQELKKNSEEEEKLLNQWKLKIFGDNEDCQGYEDCMAIWSHLDFVDPSVTDYTRQDYIPLGDKKEEN